MKFYYENKATGKYRMYDSMKQSFEWVDELNYKKEYFIFKGYNASDNGLIKYATDFYQWISELKTNNIFKIDYLKYNTHHVATEQFVLMLIQNIINDFEPIDVIEAMYINKCNCSGIQKLFIEPGTTTESYGYDFKNMYSSVLGMKSFTGIYIPTKCGTEQILTDLNLSKVPLGYYHINISSNDPQFIFNYSAEHWYTDIDIMYANKCKTNGMIIQMGLIMDNKPNAYIYSDRIKSSNIFGQWFDILTKLRDTFPQNKLIKWLLSSVWGHLCKFNDKNLSIDEIIQQDLNVATDIKKINDKNDYYINDLIIKGNRQIYNLIDAKTPFKYSKIARLKPFLLSKSRVCTCNIANLYREDVIRIHTDNITFNKQHDDVIKKFKTYPILQSETKTTGTIKWNNVNGYEII